MGPFCFSDLTILYGAIENSKIVKFLSEAPDGSEMYHFCMRHHYFGMHHDAFIRKGFSFKNTIHY